MPHVVAPTLVAVVTPARRSGRVLTAPSAPPTSTSRGRGARSTDGVRRRRRVTSRRGTGTPSAAGTASQGPIASGRTVAVGASGTAPPSFREDVDGDAPGASAVAA